MARAYPAAWPATTGPEGATPAWMRDFQMGFDFVRGIYRLNKQRVPLHQIDSLYHTRASARRAEDSAGVSREVGNGVMAVTDRGYDSREGWTVLNADPLNPRAWSLESATAVDEVGDFLGFGAARRLYSSAGVRGVAQVLMPSGIGAGQSYSLRVLYSGAPSGGLRVQVFALPSAHESTLTGVAGNLASANAHAGNWSNIRNTPLGGGIFEISATFTASVTSAARLNVGLNSAGVEQTAVFIAAQITQTAYPMPFGTGTVAPDNLVIPASAAGLAINPSITGLTMVWRGRDFESASSFGQMMDLHRDAGNRLTFERPKSTNTLRTIFALNAGFLGSDFGTPAQLPRGTEVTLMAVWRPDGTFFVKGGSQQQTVGAGRPMFSGALVSVGIGNAASSGNNLNGQTHLAAVGAFALPDPDALALFNQVAAA